LEWTAGAVKLFSDPRNAVASIKRDPSEPDEDAGTTVPGTQALTRGIALLGYVAEAKEPLRFVDLAAHAKLSRPTVHRILAALVEARLLRLDPRNQTYRLGPRLFEMAHRVWDEFDLRGAAEPELVRLTELSAETTRLGILDGDGVLYVDQRDAAQQAVRLTNRVGGRVEAHASACGKAMLAQLDPAGRARFLARLQPLSAPAPGTLTDSEALRRELDLTAARGYAISLEEQSEGVHAVAAAVLDHRARPLGAICIVGPAYRLPEARLHALGREVIEAARRTSGHAGQSAMSLEVAPRPGGSGSGAAVAVRAEALLGEGPLWSIPEQRLYWVDILQPTLHSSDIATGTDTALPLAEMVSALAPRRRGGLIAAARSGLRLLDPTQGLGETLAIPEADRPGNRFNDGKCDRQGRFWVGTLALDATPDAGALYRIGADGTAAAMVSGLHVANGLGFSQDGRRFYLADSARRRIDVFVVEPESGTLSGRRVFMQWPEGQGTPNGLAVDAEGCVWVAMWDGWCVQRFDAAGVLQRRVELPVPRPTSCAFGGPDLRTLFVTSARVRLSAEQLREAPLSGSVFAIEAGVAGLPEPAFAG
jgi:sugar lactone lactonase YvrE/DNA-binding IclR family transcriptional regulator